MDSKKNIWRGNVKKFFLLYFVFSLCIIGFFFSRPPVYVDLDSSFCSPFTKAHILGCDRLGRDHFALLTYGILLTSLISFPARLVTLVFAFGISLLASYLPKFFKDMFDSISAVFLSIPSLLVALIIVSIFQGTYTSFLLSITISDWASSYETIQVKIKEIQESNFTQISRNMGASNFYIFQRHIFPEIKELLINLFLTGIPAVIMTVSIFSYMGVDFGTDTFGPGLGEQISFSKDFAHVAPLSVIIPILGIILLVLSVHISANRSINKPS